METATILKEAGKAATYYPALATITGSGAAALFLSYIIILKGTQSDADGWIAKTSEEIEHETGLTPNEQEAARGRLKKAELLEERQGSVTPLCWRVDIDRIKRTLVPVTAQPAPRQATTQQPADEADLSLDMVPDIVRDTPFANLGKNALEGFISVYGLTKVVRTLDVLAAIHRVNPEAANPASLLTRGLMKGVTPPEGFVSAINRLKVLKKREKELIGKGEVQQPAPEQVRQPEKPGAGPDSFSDAGFLP
jgi:hypothetical protein